MVIPTGSLVHFCHVKLEGSDADCVTLLALLAVYDSATTLQFGKCLHAYATQKGLYKEVNARRSLIARPRAELPTRQKGSPSLRRLLQC